MKLIQRLGDALSDEFIEKFIDRVKKYPGSCDEVWLPTPYGYPKMEYHQKYAQRLKKYAGEFRENGIMVSLQLSNSIGHGEYMSRKDCSGLVYDGSPVEKMVGQNGVIADYGFCWNGHHFKQYLLDTVALYSENVKPDYIWVDDDFRAPFHAPVEFGCFCDECMLRFNEEYGASFTREELVNEFLHGDIAWRERFIKFIRSGIYRLAYEIGETAHRHSPKTGIGYQYCANGVYAGEGYSYIFDGMRDSTGITPVSRPGGGAYNDCNPMDFVEKGLHLCRANSMLPDYVKVKCPEIENLPFVAFGKSPAGTALETSHYFAAGNTDMSYSMLMNTNEPLEWYEKELNLFSKQRGYWEKLSEYNLNSQQSGLQYYISPNLWKKGLAANEGFYDLNAEYYEQILPLLRDAIPVTLERNEDSIIILHPEEARHMQPDEIENLLSKNVITDGETVEILRSKGFDLGIECRLLDDKTEIRLCEHMCEHKTLPKGLEKWTVSFFVEGRNKAYYIEPTDKAEILGIYALSEDTPLPPLCDNKQYPYGIAEAIVNVNDGAKWAILAYKPWKGIISTAKREQILNIADYIGDDCLPARLLSPVPAVLFPRTNGKGETVCVSMTNCTVGESGEMRLIIRRPAGNSFELYSQYGQPLKLQYRKNGNDYLINIPSIPGWSVATVFVSK